MRGKAFLPFLQGVPARYTELQWACLWVFSGEEHLHMTICYQNEFEDGTKTSKLTT